MKKIFILTWLSILLSEISYTQEAFHEKEVHAKLVEAINKYQQVSNFTLYDLNARINYRQKFNSLFFDEYTLINDLPLPSKIKVTVSTDEYLDLLYTNFTNGLKVKIDTGQMKIKYYQDEDNSQVWESDVFLRKSLSGLINGQLFSLTLDIHLELILIKDEFLIASITCPNDIDADGVENSEDICYDLPGYMQNTGCPDLDKDGVPINIDRCLNTPFGREVDEFGCEKTKFINNVSYEVNLSSMMNRLKHFEAIKASPFSFRINDYEKWIDNSNSGDSWPTSFSFEFKAIKPLMHYDNIMLGLISGLGIYNYTNQLFVYETNNRKNFPSINNQTPDYEKSIINYIGIPVGLKYTNSILYLETGLNNLIYIGGERKVYLENKETLIGTDNKIKNAIKSYRLAPYLGLGIQFPIHAKLGFQAGLKYCLINNFSKYNKYKFMEYDDREARSITEAELPYFIEMVKPTLSIHSISIDLGITYNLSMLAD